MADVATLQARLEKLRALRQNGAREVDTGDYRTKFGSDAELIAAIADLEGQLQIASGTRAVRTVRFSSHKGLCR